MSRRLWIDPRTGVAPSDERLGMADGKPVIHGEGGAGACGGFCVPCLEGATPLHPISEIAMGYLRLLLPNSSFAVLQLVTAHDGSLGEALSRAIVLRAEAIGLPALLNVSASEKEPKE